MTLNSRTFIFMGVSGCGKSTIGSAFARAIGGEFRDGDDFHPPANIAKMSSGTPLDDSDRSGWLDAIRDTISGSDAQILCIACSALKKKHRDHLRGASGQIDFVYLHGSRELLQQRHSERSGHFMPVELLDSQLADLEKPRDSCKVDIASSPEAILAELRAHFSL